jgi:AcrR family transcriptional regulator
MKPSRRSEIGLGKRERTRMGLVASAYRVFAQKDINLVTIDDIIAEAGVARGTFYNYFQTREDALKAVADFLRDEMKQKIETQSAISSDPAERLVLSIRQLLHHAMQDQTWGWVVVRIGLSASSRIETIETTLGKDLQLGIQSNRFQVDSFPATLTLILGTGLLALRRILEEPTEPDYPEQVAKILLKSLGINDAEAEAIAFKTLERSQDDRIS